MTGPAPVQSVDRALTLLELLAAAGGRAAISELAERSALSLGTTHRLLSGLAARGWVRQEADRRYALGPALLPLGSAATRLLGSWAEPYLVQLAAETGETSNLAVLEDDHVVYVAQAPGAHRMRMFTEVGRRVLPHSTAVGKVLLAAREEAHVRRAVKRLGLPPRTVHTLTDVSAFLAELGRVRERGWAVDDEEEELGVRCLAVPVGDPPMAAVSVSAPASRLDSAQPDVLAALRSAARALAATLSTQTAGSADLLPHRGSEFRQAVARFAPVAPESDLPAPAPAASRHFLPKESS